MFYEIMRNAVLGEKKSFWILTCECHGLDFLSFPLSVPFVSTQSLQLYVVTVVLGTVSKRIETKSLPL